MNLEKNLAEGKNFALLTQDNGVGDRRLAGIYTKTYPGLGPAHPETPCAKPTLESPSVARSATSSHSSWALRI